MAVQKSWACPVNVGWLKIGTGESVSDYDYESGNMSSPILIDKEGIVNSKSDAYKVKFYLNDTSYTTFVCAYKYRYRYKPSYVEENSLSSEWTAYSSYRNIKSGNVTEYDTLCSIVKDSDGTGFTVNNALPSSLFDYDTLFDDDGMYDAVEITVAIRVQKNSSGTKYKWSNWTYKTFAVGFVPFISFSGFKPLYNGGIRGTVSSNHERKTTVKLGNPSYRHNGITYKDGSGSASFVLSGTAPVLIDIPSTMYRMYANIGGSHTDVHTPAVFCDSSVTTVDGSMAEVWNGLNYLYFDDVLTFGNDDYVFNNHIAIPITSNTPLEFEEPTVTVSYDENGNAIVSVDAAQCREASELAYLYDLVFEVSSKDRYGRSVRLEPEITEQWTEDTKQTDYGKWLCRIVALPYNSDITATLYINQRYSASSTTVYTYSKDISGLFWSIPSANLCTFTSDDGSESVNIKFNRTPSYSYANNAESVKVAGRDDPISRYGEGGERNFKLEGTALNPHYGQGGAWKDGIAALEESHDWIYRAEDGTRARVMISSVSCSEDKKSIDEWVDISINMTQVSG